MPVHRHRSLDTAPQDGRYVMVFNRGAAQPVKAYWSAQLVGWIDVSGRILGRAEAWEPIGEHPAETAPK